WWRYLNNLEKWSMLNIKKTNKFSVVSILKWSDYQENEHQMNNKRTSDEHQMNTNKNVKNVKNVEEEEEGENPFLVYEQNFGILKPILRESLIAWCEDLGDDIVIAGMKLAAQKGGNTFSYLEAIWKEWASQNLKTLDEVRAYEKEKIKKRNRKVTPINRRKTAGEIDWDNL